MDRAVLVEHLAAGRSLDTVAKLEGRAPSTIGYWLKKHGLEACGSRRFGPKPDIDKGRLERLVSEGLTVPAIAARLGYPASLVRSRLRHHGLQTRGVNNRQRARVAFARGAHQVDLVCAAHGTVPHVLEGAGVLPLHALPRGAGDRTPAASQTAPGRRGRGRLRDLWIRALRRCASVPPCGSSAEELCSESCWGHAFSCPCAGGGRKVRGVVCQLPRGGRVRGREARPTWCFTLTPRGGLEPPNLD